MPGAERPCPCPTTTARAGSGPRNSRPEAHLGTSIRPALRAPPAPPEPRCRRSRLLPAGKPFKSTGEGAGGAGETRDWALPGPTEPPVRSGGEWGEARSRSRSAAPPAPSPPARAALAAPPAGACAGGCRALGGGLSRPMGRPAAPACLAAPAAGWAGGSALPPWPLLRSAPASGLSCAPKPALLASPALCTCPGSLLCYHSCLLGLSCTLHLPPWLLLCSHTCPGSLLGSRTCPTGVSCTLRSSPGLTCTPRSALGFSSPVAPLEGPPQTAPVRQVLTSIPVRSPEL